MSLKEVACPTIPAMDISMKNAMCWFPAAFFALALIVAPFAAKAQAQPCVSPDSGDGLAIAALVSLVDETETALGTTLEAAVTGNLITRVIAVSQLLAAEVKVAETKLVLTAQAPNLNAVLPYRDAVEQSVQGIGNALGLFSGGLYAPHWNVNANSVLYVQLGRARVQVVADVRAQLPFICVD